MRDHSRVQSAVWPEHEALSSVDGDVPRVTVIIPAFNEATGLPVVLHRLYEVIDRHVEVIVVDDGSKDSTAEVARRFPCRVILHHANQGKGVAIRTGLRFARGERIIVIDADDTYPAEMVPQLATLLDDYDMVIASRVEDTNHIPWVNRVGNGLFRALIRVLYGFRGKDPLTGLYALHKTRVDQMKLSADGFGVETEIAIKAARMGLRILDVPIAYNRRLGTAKLHAFRDGTVIFRTIIRLVSLYNPLLTFVVPGLVLMGVGAAILGIRLVNLDPLRLGFRGPHSLVLGAMMVLAGYQIFTLGIVVRVYASAHRFARAGRLVTLLRWPHIGKLTAAAGLLFTGFGLVKGTSLLLQWLFGGRGPFTNTELAIMSSFLVVLGVQIFFSTVFLSIFLEEIHHRAAEGMEVVVDSPARSSDGSPQ